MATPFPDHPQLTGNFAPIRMECDLDDVIIRGEIPRDLSITYYRNGPDPQFSPKGDHHWFAGDGMLHMFVIEDGRVRYRNRWVRTAKWQLERQQRRSLYNPFNPMENDPVTQGVEDDGLANTNVVWHGGKLLALEEGHAPFAIDPQTLASEGAWRFGGEFEGPMTAHPKMDPKTGEMLFFGYMVGGMFSPGMSYQTVDASGALTRSERFEAPFASMVHDFITTDEHVVFPIFPATGSMERAMSGQPPLAWEPDKGTHIGVMRRDGSVAEMRWFETDPCYVFHPMNAYTEGNRIIAHVMQFEEVPLFPHADGSPPDPGKGQRPPLRVDHRPGRQLQRRAAPLSGRHHRRVPAPGRALHRRQLPPRLLRRRNRRQRRRLGLQRLGASRFRRRPAQRLHAAGRGRNRRAGVRAEVRGRRGRGRLPDQRGLSRQREPQRPDLPGCAELGGRPHRLRRTAASGAVRLPRQLEAQRLMATAGFSAPRMGA